MREREIEKERVFTVRGCSSRSKHSHLICSESVTHQPQRVAWTKLRRETRAFISVTAAPRSGIFLAAGPCNRS